MCLIRRCSQPAVSKTSSQQVYEVRSRKDHRGVDLISDAPVAAFMICVFISVFFLSFETRPFILACVATAPVVQYNDWPIYIWDGFSATH